MVHDATALQREEIPLTDMIISTKCGESDTTSGLGSNPTIGRFAERFTAAGGTFFFGETSELTGGEHIVADRISDPVQREKFQRLFDEHQRIILEQEANLLGSQPTEGNIAGGLTTIEEKALGNIQKIGQAKIDGVLEMAEAPTRRGLHFMDTSSAAAESVTLFAAGGAALHLFTTGQGNIIGNPIVPVLKLTANPKTVAHDERAHRPRRLAADHRRHDAGPGRRRDRGHRRRDGVRALVRGRGPRSQGVRAHAPAPHCVAGSTSRSREAVRGRAARGRRHRRRSPPARPSTGPTGGDLRPDAPWCSPCSSDSRTRRSAATPRRRPTEGLSILDSGLGFPIDCRR